MLKVKLNSSGEAGSFIAFSLQNFLTFTSKIEIKEMPKSEVIIGKLDSEQLSKSRWRSILDFQGVDGIRYEVNLIGDQILVTNDKDKEYVTRQI